LQAGHSLSAAGCDCATAHAAVAAGHYGCLKRRLAAAPGSAGAVNAAGQTPLHAVDHSDSSGLCISITTALRRALRSAGSLNEMIEHADAAGQTPLESTVWQLATVTDTAVTAATAAATANGGGSASERLCVKCANQMLQAGAAVSSELSERLLELAAAELSDATAELSDAIEERCVDLVEHLKDRGMVPLPECLRAAAMDTGPHAVAKLQLLFKCGADPDQHYENDCTLLHLIARGPADSRYEPCHMQSRKQMLQLLVKESTTLLQYEVTSDESCALHMAYRYSELIKELIELRVPVNHANDDGYTPLVSHYCTTCTAFGNMSTSTYVLLSTDFHLMLKSLTSTYTEHRPPPSLLLLPLLHVCSISCASTGTSVTTLQQQ
jgi:hypothetical protein